jgi:serine/threonine protein kinase
MDAVGRALAGRYELVEVIGRGGMGTVYRAVDLVLGRAVAVKMLPGLLADQDPTSVARFEREARAAAALSHPAVVAVYDTGADGTTRFIVMELVAGRSLEAILRTAGPLDPARAAGIVARVADALAAAHAAGIVHRDVKPANVMVTADGSVKVLDFGIARVAGGTTLTQNASVLGTAAYMAPEQASGEPADERSDIYSLGCVLYALIAGGPPFTGEGAAAILHQHASVAPRSLRGENGRVSPELDALVMQMLAKAPGERPQTAAQVRDRLTPLSARPSATPAVTAPTARVRQTSATRALPPVVPPDRRRLRLIVAGALAVLVLVIAVAALGPGGSSPRVTTRAGRDVKARTSQRRSPATAASTKPAAAASTAPAASTPTTASSNTATPPTVSAGASALSALVTQGVRSGTIDQQAAQQITNAASDIMSSLTAGRTVEAQNKLAELSQQIPKLEHKGQVTPAVASALNTALASLGTAFANAPAPTTPAPDGQSGPPPAQDGQPPGQAKQDHKHGH